MRYYKFNAIFVVFIFTLNILYGNCTTNGVLISFEKLSEITTGNNPFDVQIYGNLAIVADYYGGLSVFDVTNASEPLLIANQPLTHAHYFHVFDNYAYVACWEYGVKIINITDPSNLAEVGFYVDGIEVGAAFVANNVAIVSKNDGGVLLLNVSDPTNPQKIFQYNATGVPHVCCIREDIAYVAYWEESGSRIVFLDITDPTSPEFFGEYEDVGADTYDFDLEDDLLVIANDDLGISFVNISVLDTPLNITEYNTKDSAMGVDIFNNYVFVGDSDTIEVIDFSDFNNLKAIGFYDDIGEMRKLQIVNDLIYVCNKPYGLVILRYTIEEITSSFKIAILPIIACLVFITIVLNLKYRKRT